MEKRVIIAFVLSFVVLYAFRALYSPPPTGQEPQQAAQASPPSSQKAPVVPPLQQNVEAPEVAHAAEIQGGKTEDFTVDTPLYTAIVSNIGGVLKSYKLKDYTDGAGHSLELINQSAPMQVGSPLAITTGDKTIDDQLAKAAFAGHREGDSLSLEFAGSGLYVRKDLAFDKDKYLFSLKATVTKEGKPVPYSLVWQGVFGDQSIAQDVARKNAVYQSDVNAYKRVALRSLKDPQDFNSPRAGVEDQYFLAAFMFGMPEAVKIRKQEYNGPDGKPVPSLAVSYSVPQDTAIRIYVGPKQRQSLQQADPELYAALDYGYFGFIAKPLLDILLWIHKYVGNFGWAIILLTVGLTLILFPLRLKQQVSMLKMQKIQPHMRRLQDQYKKLKASDPRRTQVQTDMMNLYKEHGVNPMGGCLPLLLQMPLLFAFYSALGYSIELRRAPWIFWIKDLSQPDPYYIIPIAMAVAMFAQQKLTPTPNVDPAQAKMMLVMPIVFTFMFLNYGSGLALYWLTSNIISVGQQIFINKYWSPQAEAKLRARPRPNEQQGT
ncbi:MAG TPA: membrane protein insertase YidC [Terriglobia bacterium]|jgi:YidC/Oxa1 family membrane protein insertase